MTGDHPMGDAAAVTGVVTGVGVGGHVHGTGSAFMVSAKPKGGGFAVQISVPFDPTRWQGWDARALTETGGAGPGRPTHAEPGLAVSLPVGVTKVGVTASFSVGPDGRIGPASVSLGPIQTTAECTYGELADALTKPADAASRYPGVPLCRVAQTSLAGNGGEGVSGTTRKSRLGGRLGSGGDVVAQLEWLGDVVFTAWATTRGLPLIKPHSWEARTVAAMSVRIELALGPSAGEAQPDISLASFTSGLGETAAGLNFWTIAADLGGTEAPFSVEHMQILAAHYAAAGQSAGSTSRHRGADVLTLPGVLDPQISAADLLGSLNGAGFEQYLAAAAATVEVALGVAEQVEKRLNNDTVTPASALIVLTEAVGHAAMSLLLSNPGRLVHIEFVPLGDGENQFEAQLVVQYPDRPVIIRARSPQFSGDDAAARTWSFRKLYAQALDIDGVASRLMQQRLICTATERPIDAQLATALVLLALDGVPLPEPIEARCFQWVAAEPGRALAVIAATGTGAVGWADCKRVGQQHLKMAGASMTRSDGTKLSVPVVIGEDLEAGRRTVAVTVIAKLLHQKTMDLAAPAPVQPLIDAIQATLAEGRDLVQTVSRWDVRDLADVLSYSALGGSVPTTVANAIVGLAERREIAPELALNLIHHDDRTQATPEPKSHPTVAGPWVGKERVALGDMVFSSGPVKGLRELQVRHVALATLIARLLHVPPPDVSESLLPIAYGGPTAHTANARRTWLGNVQEETAAAIAKVIFRPPPSDPGKRAELWAEQADIIVASRLLPPRGARFILKAAAELIHTGCKVEFSTTETPPPYPLSPGGFHSTASVTVPGAQLESTPFIAENPDDAEDLAAANLLERIWKQQQQQHLQDKNVLQ